MSLCRSLPLAALLLAFSLPSSTLRAQESAGTPEPISTERPTLGPSPDVVPAASLQLENGAAVSLQRHAAVADLPESFVRLGLNGRVDLRFQTSDLMVQTAPGSSASLVTADTAISVKALIGKPNQFVPRSAILQLSLPTGGAGFTSGSYDPTLASIWTQSLPRGYFVNEVAQATLTTLNGARRPMWAPSVAGGRAFNPVLSAFAEYAPSVLPDSSYAYTVDGGAIFTVKTSHQIDLRSGYTADANGIHTLLGIGYSVRYDRYFHR